MIGRSVTRNVGAAQAWRLLARLGSPGGVRGRLSVLIYHRVLQEPDPLRPGDVTVETFRWQMEALASCFRPVPLNEGVRRLLRGSLPARAVAVTFDDGYADNHDRALPILQAAGVPATFFVTTGTLGDCMWNDAVVEAVRALPRGTVDTGCPEVGALTIAAERDRPAALTKLLWGLRRTGSAQRDAVVQRLLNTADVVRPSGLMMDREQLRAMHNAGMEIGAHTVTHPILARMPAREAETEIAACRETLEGILGAPVRMFAYPNGRPGEDYLPEHVEMVRRAGFKAAFSTQPGANRCESTDPLQVRRFTPWDRTPQRFVARLLWHSLQAQ